MLIPAGLGFSGAMAAVIATARYVKHTEDDTVSNMRLAAKDLVERAQRCEAEMRELRAEVGLLHRQVAFLMRVIDRSDLEMPPGFPEG